LHNGNASSVDHFTRLPLHTVTILEFARTYSSGLGFFELPMGAWNGGLDDVPEALDDVPEALDDVPEALRQAAASLAGCPAWQRAPAPKLALFGDPEGFWHGPATSDSDDETYHDDGEVRLPEESFTQEQALALFEALAPLGGPHVKEVELCVDSMCFDLGEAEVDTLGWSVCSGHVR
jgi:hypothetical protein